jgi:hypothetical protein
VTFDVWYQDQKRKHNAKEKALKETKRAAAGAEKKMNFHFNDIVFISTVSVSVSVSSKAKVVLMQTPERRVSRQFLGIRLFFLGRDFFSTAGNFSSAGKNLRFFAFPVALAKRRVPFGLWVIRRVLSDPVVRCFVPCSVSFSFFLL